MKQRKSIFLYIGVSWPFIILILCFWLPVGYWIFKYASNFQPFDVIKDAASFELAKNSLLIASLTTLFSIFTAYPIAFYWWLGSRKVSRIIILIVFLPILVGLLARNYSWIGLFVSRGTYSSLGLSHVFSEVFLYSLESVIFVMTYVFIPIAFFILIYAFSSINRIEIEAARTLGASGYEIVKKIVLPHTYRQTLIGIILIFASAVGYFVTPRMVGGGNIDMIGNLIQRYTDLGLFSEASSVSLSFLFLLIPFYIVSFWLIIKSRKRILGR